MRLFDKLFGSRATRNAWRLVANAQARTKKTYGPVFDLGATIVKTADGAYRAGAQGLGYSLDGTPTEAQILVFAELLFFFAHLSLREIVSAGFTEPQISKLQSHLVPLLTSTLVGSFFGDWPEELQGKLRDEAFANLNSAEVDYSGCKGFISRDEPFSRTTLLGRLGWNVAESLGKPGDPAIMTAAITAALDARIEMKLEEAVARVKGVIDSVEAYSGP